MKVAEGIQVVRVDGEEVGVVDVKWMGWSGQAGRRWVGSYLHRSCSKGLIFFQ